MQWIIVSTMSVVWNKLYCIVLKQNIKRLNRLVMFYWTTTSVYTITVDRDLIMSLELVCVCVDQLLNQQCLLLFFIKIKYEFIKYFYLTDLSFGQINNIMELLIIHCLGFLIKNFSIMMVINDGINTKFKVYRIS